MNDLEKLRQAILLDPHDLVVRLAYADALEEAGHKTGINHAQIIREMISQRKIPHQHKKGNHCQRCIENGSLRPMLAWANDHWRATRHV